MKVVIRLWPTLAPKGRHRLHNMENKMLNVANVVKDARNLTPILNSIPRVKVPVRSLENPPLGVVPPRINIP